MSARSRSDSPDHAGASSKRARSSRMKACDRCVSSKLRCEAVQADGCRRCRARKDGTLCSLATVSSAHAYPADTHVSTDSAQASPHVRQQEQQINELHSRVAWLEAQLAQTTPSSGGAGASIVGTTLVPSRTGSIVTYNGVNAGWANNPSMRYSDHATKEGLEWRGAWHGLSDHSAAMVPTFEETRFEFTREMPRRLSPVELGLVTDIEYEVAFLRVHRDIPALLPLYPLNTLRCEQSSDPLVTAAVLLQSPAARVELFGQLDHMALTNYGRPVDSAYLLAHLLLSLAPVHQNMHGARPEPVDILGAAYEYGSRMGLEMWSLKALSRQGNWGALWYEEIVQRCLLWEMIKARYSIMRIFSSPSITELPLPNVDLYPPKGPTDAITATLEYLRRLHYLISLAKPLAQELHDLELESMDTFSDPDKFRHFGEKWKALDRQITAKQTEWKVKHDLLFYDSHLVSQWFLLRASIFFQRLPTPLNADMHAPGNSFIGTCFQVINKRVVDIITDIPTDPSVGPVLSQLPAYIIKMSIISVLTARLTLASYRGTRVRAGNHDLFEERKVAEAEERFEALGGVVGDFFAAKRERRIQAEALLSLSDRQTAQPDASNPGLGQLDSDWFSVDFNAWLASSDNFLAYLAPDQMVPPQ